MNNKVIREFDKIFDIFRSFLNEYGKSEVLCNCFLAKYWSFFYGTLIDNFFKNLTAENVLEQGLSKGKIGLIKRRFSAFRKDVKAALNISSFKITIDEKYYEDFKHQVGECEPSFSKIIDFIEKEVSYKATQALLNEKGKKLSSIGKTSLSLNEIYMTKMLEGFIQHKHCFPSSATLAKFTKKTIGEMTVSFSDVFMKSSQKSSAWMLKEQRTTNSYYDKRRYKRWKTPLDSFECLIRIAFESGAGHRDKLLNSDCNVSSFKLDAIVKIHARAVQIANEIFVLLKAGYPDGAMARWRGLHELAVISLFLKDSPEEVSQRYLDHYHIRSFKEASDYKTYYAKLGYAPLGRKVHGALASSKRRLCSKYNDKFQEEYGWIPSTILSNRNFRALEERVKLDFFHPYYNLSCNAVHGGAKGFYRLGMTEQDKVLLTGPSNYGLADPLQNAAASLAHITSCLLSFEPDLDSLTHMQVLKNYAAKIARDACDVQFNIEHEESFKKKVIDKSR